MATDKNTVRLQIYTLNERLWHWVQALGVIILLVTGFLIHYPRTGSEGFVWIIYAHNYVGAVVLANAVLGLLYQLFSNRIKRYLSMPTDFFGGAVEQAKYYMGGIFRGEPHPFEKGEDHHLNPLQAITYLGLLNILLPFQLATGIMIWGSTYWPEAFEAVGGLRVVAPLHTLGAFLMLAFLIMHVYLTTTGHTLLSNLKAMILGYEDVPQHQEKTGE